MFPIIGLFLGLLVSLIEGAPGCHWDPLAPIFLQQEEEGARAWIFTLGEPFTVPNVIGLKQTIKKYELAKLVIFNSGGQTQGKRC